MWNCSTSSISKYHRLSSKRGCDNKQKKVTLQSTAFPEGCTFQEGLPQGFLVYTTEWSLGMEGKDEFENDVPVAVNLCVCVCMFPFFLG